MCGERPAKLHPFGEWLVTGHEHAAPLFDELMPLPVPEWEAWLAAHPDARTVHIFQGVLEAARADPAQALAMTDFVVRHADSVTVPPEADFALAWMREEAWKARAQALRSAGDPAGAQEAQERSDAILRAQPRPRPRTNVPPTKADARRAEELIKKYGWRRRDKR